MKNNMEKNDNLKLWNSVEKTNTKFTKEAGFGRKFTSIDPTYQMKNATEHFGRYGVKWGLRDMEWDMIDVPAAQKMVATLSAVFFTPDGEVATGNAVTFYYVTSKGKHDVDEEYRKKLITNTISKELSRLGFNADVFLGKFEDERYVEALQKEEMIDDLAEVVLLEMEKAKTLEQLQEYFINLKPSIKNSEKVIAKKDELKEKLTTIKDEDTK